MRAVLDTNILIDHLAGVAGARKEIDRYRFPCISRITWMEVLVGARDDDEEAILRAFLGRFRVIEVDDAVAREAVEIRKIHKVRLPDAIIWGTARSLGCLLVTRNTDDFPRSEPDVRVPYRA